MAENRIRKYLGQPDTAVATAEAAPTGFVPCPVVMFTGFVAAQQSFVAEVYRLAREMTEAQLRQAARTFPPAFSLN